MHYCPICRKKCDCPEQETKDLPFSTCVHCTDDQDEFGPEHEFKPSRRKWIMRMLAIVDVAATLICYICCVTVSFYLVINKGEYFNATLLFVVAYILIIVQAIYRKL